MIGQPAPGPAAHRADLRRGPHRLLGDLVRRCGDHAVIVVNTTVGVVQEIRADRAITALTDLSAPRGPGDPGRCVSDRSRPRTSSPVICWCWPRATWCAADADVIEPAALLVDESSLTGESVPVDKSPAATEHRRPTGVGRHGGGPWSGAGYGLRPPAADSATGRLALLCSTVGTLTLRCSGGSGAQSGCIAAVASGAVPAGRCPGSVAGPAMGASDRHRNQPDGGRGPRVAAGRHHAEPGPRAPDGWPRTMPSSADCLPWKRWVRCQSSPPTRPAPSPRAGWWPAAVDADRDGAVTGAGYAPDGHGHAATIDRCPQPTHPTWRRCCAPPCCAPTPLWRPPGDDRPDWRVLGDPTEAALLAAAPSSDCGLPDLSADRPAGGGVPLRQPPQANDNRAPPPATPSR